MDEAKIIEALAKWLGIKPEQVHEFYLIHKCKPLQLKTLIDLLK